MQSTLTPDFYEYDWDSITAVSVEDHYVLLRWSDGLEYRAFDLWLRENAIGAGGVDPATREGIFDPADHLDETTASVADVTADGALRIVWAPDGAEAVYHPGWLRHVATGQHAALSWLPESTPWTAATLREPPTHDGTNVLDDPDVLAGWVNDLLQYGIARLRHLPLDPDLGLALGSRMGAVRNTNFGAIWDVKADVEMAGAADTNSSANTSLRLGPHTDLPTRETPPGFQFLHCIANTTQGGFSTMADGAAVAAYLEANEPAHYEALTTLRWIFFNRGPGIDHRWSGPIIDHGVPGSPLTFRFFAGVRGFPDMDPADMPRAYAAMRCFSRLAADEGFQMRYPFAPGDMVAFDNRRILHGRDAYASSGSRHLRGIYIDHDDVRSFARVANRSRNQHNNHSLAGSSHA